MSDVVTHEFPTNTGAVGEPLFTRDQLAAWLDAQGFPKGSYVHHVVIDIDAVDGWMHGPTVEISFWLKNEEGHRYLLTDAVTGERKPAQDKRRLRMHNHWRPPK